MSDHFGTFGTGINSLTNGASLCSFDGTGGLCFLIRLGWKVLFTCVIIEFQRFEISVDLPDSRIL